MIRAPAPTCRSTRRSMPRSSPAGFDCNRLQHSRPATLAAIGYNRRMSSLSPEEARKYLAGLTLANEFEIHELRNAPVELKMRQLWTLMMSPELVENESRRAIEVQEIRERWARLYQALRA